MEKERDILIRKLRIFAILTRALEIESERNNICFLSNVVDSHFQEPKKELVFEIQKRPEFLEPIIYDKVPIFNHSKHEKTCAKNRKKRKRKKRR